VGALLLRALYELTITVSALDGDPDRDMIPTGQTTNEQIEAMVFAAHAAGVSSVWISSGCPWSIRVRPL
jgi:hypothetical protein